MGDSLTVKVSYGGKSIGYKMGGPILAFLTMMVWALPVLVVMTLLSFLYQFLDSANISEAGLRYIGPMAVGFIIVAAYRIGRKVVKDKITVSLLLLGAITTYFIREPWIFPVVLIVGGVVSIITSKEKNLWNRVKLNPPWVYFSAYAGGLIAVAAIILMQKSGFVIDNIIVTFATLVLLITKKIPAPFIVLLAIVTGFIF